MAVTQPTVKSMRQGTKLLLGKYSANKDAEPVPIAWTKATPNGDFIASFALDYLCADARERQFRENGTSYMNGGNPLYHLSNIHTFLNSNDDEWYSPTHEEDNAPTSDYRDVNGYGTTYSAHYGFLRHFEDYELASVWRQTVEINGIEVCSQFRLPLSTEIFGQTKFNLFKKGAVRAHPSLDMVNQKQRVTGIDSTAQYTPYLLADRNEHWSECMNIVDRTGCIYHSSPAQGCGIRPVCRIKLDAKVEEVEPGIYELLPFDFVPMRSVTNEEIREFLGLA